MDYRLAMRTIQDKKHKEEKNEKSIFLPYIIEYEKVVANELHEKCLETINFVDDNIIRKKIFKNLSMESKTFFMKMKGDIYRFLSEIEIFKKKYIKDATDNYNEALKFSNNLPIYNQYKIGLMLNISIFYYEIVEDKKRAIELAKYSLIEFEKNSKDIDEDENNYSFVLYDYLKENLEIWEKEYKK